jgi:hypothetical protein
MKKETQMKYQLYCPNEGCTKYIEEVEVEAPMAEGPPKMMFCPHCQTSLSRDFNGSIHIPEHLRATHDLASNFDDIKSTMRRAKRPSGKERLFY